jgi:hypothetical protein
MSYLTLLGCDSLIVIGCTTSGCVRATFSKQSLVRQRLCATNICSIAGRSYDSERLNTAAFAETDPIGPR